MKTTAAIAVLILAAIAGCTRDASQQLHPRVLRPSPAAELASQDRDFLERAAEGNNAEITMGAITRGHSSDPRVLAFGQMLVADHTAAKSALETIAATMHIALPTGLGDQQASYDQLIEKHRQTFDRDFVRAMAGAHDQAVQLFQGEATNGADPQLKAYAAANLPVLVKHRDEAKAIDVEMQAMGNEG